MISPDALGDNLAILSLRVAHEIDRRLNHQKFDPSVFTDFGRELSKASGIDEAHSTAFLHSDPTTTEVFAQAIVQTSAEQISDINELGEAIGRIIEPLKHKGAELSEKELTAMKRFCLSLHKSMMAQRVPPVHEGENSFEDELGFVR